MVQSPDEDVVRIVVRALDNAIRRGDDEVGPPLLLLAVAEGRPGATLERYGLSCEAIRQVIDHRGPHIAGRGRWNKRPPDLVAIRDVLQSELDADTSVGSFGGRRAHAHRALSTSARKSLELSLREAMRCGLDHAVPESLVLGLLRTDDTELRRVLEHAGVDGVGVDEAGLRDQLESQLLTSVHRSR